METKSNAWKANAKKNVLHLGYWTGRWVTTMAIASFGQIYLWINYTALTCLFIAINGLVGIGMILMNRQYINDLGEVQRRVSLDAMAIALGVGVVGGLSYSMLGQANVIAGDAEIAHVVMLIGITYMIAIFVGNNRYK